MNTNITLLDLSIDGGYFCKINDSLSQVGCRLNLAKLTTFIRECIAEMENGSIKEKGIDVWFALGTHEMAVYRDFDFVVLITGDADHEMLARKIKALKKRVVLVT